jgi:hypothetical protein
MTTAYLPDTLNVIDRLHRAWNQHDLDALVGCFHPDYMSTQPVHPDRNFQGQSLVRLSWDHIFRAVPDLQAELVSCAIDGDMAWTEWCWEGTHVEGNPFYAGGVMVFGLAGEQIAWSRIYTETPQVAGPDFDRILDDILGRESEPSEH